ncbi:MAG: hypothetical protein HOE48_18005, partial [Candidatus Latescibacteria bacterium]|nr:hypothetical protein [Candidatus Latescibacterota bacterium]
REAALDSLVVSEQVEDITQAIFENNWRTREGLIDVLERLRAVSALADIATQHPKLDAQRLAIRSLGRVEDKAAQIPLRALLRSNHRDLAVEALGVVGDVSDVVRVRALLKDERADVRRRAALALVKLAGHEHLKDLVLLLGDPHHSVRFAMLEPLVSFGEQGAQTLFSVYPHLPVVGKLLALRLFGQLHFAPASPILEDALRDDLWPVQLAAVQSIGNLGGMRWGAILKKAQNKVSSPVVIRAIQDVLEQLQ